METTPSKKFNLNNIKKLIKEANGDNPETCVVIERNDFEDLLKLTSNGFDIKNKANNYGR
jgi:hypothetical protein